MRFLVLVRSVPIHKRRIPNSTGQTKWLLSPSLRLRDFDKIKRPYLWVIVCIVDLMSLVAPPSLPPRCRRAVVPQRCTACTPGSRAALGLVETATDQNGERCRIAVELVLSAQFHYWRWKKVRQQSRQPSFPGCCRTYVERPAFRCQCHVCWVVVHIPAATEDPSVFKVISRIYPGFLTDLPGH